MSRFLQRGGTIDSPPTCAPAAPRSARQLLMDRVFGSYMAGTFVSSIGNWFQNVAAAFLVFELTGSSILVGFVGVVQFGSTMLLAPIAGAAADRIDRRRLMILAQVIAFAGAVGLAGLMLAVGVDGLPGVWPVFVASGVIGVGYAISVPTGQAMVPALVPRPDLSQAIALNSVTFNLARAVGPGLAGLVLTVAGAGIAFSVNATTFGVFIVVLWLIRPPGVTMVDAVAGEDRSVRAGFRVAMADPFIVRALLVTLVLGFATDPVSTLAPAMAELHGGGSAFVGYVGSAFGAGAVVASLALSRLQPWFPRTRLAEVGYLALAVGMAVASFAPVGGIALVGIAIAGGGFLFAVTTINGALQHRLEEGVRGRVMALWSVAFLGLRPIAGIVDGGLADLAGVGAGLGFAAASATVAAVGLRLTRHLDPAQ